jgi:Zn-dependent protease with chaperone function
MNSVPLRHPQEILRYVICATLNLLIVAIIVAGIIEAFRLPGLWGLELALPLLALLLVFPALVIIQALQRTSTRASAVRLSRTRFPAIYTLKETFASKLTLKRIPAVYVTADNGVLNAFGTSGQGFDYVVVYSDLLSNTYEANQRVLAFILGHELAHLKLGHTRLWYQFSLAYIDRFPLLGAWLSRAREYSCDRHGAFLEPEGGDGLVLLAAGRYIYHQVNVTEVLEQRAAFHGFWPLIVRLPMSHPPLTLRIKALYHLGLFGQPQPIPTRMGASDDQRQTEESWVKQPISNISAESNRGPL